MSIFATGWFRLHNVKVFLLLKTDTFLLLGGVSAIPVLALVNCLSMAVTGRVFRYYKALIYNGFPETSGRTAITSFPNKSILLLASVPL